MYTSRENEHDEEGGELNTDTNEQDVNQLSTYEQQALDLVLTKSSIFQSSLYIFAFMVVYSSVIIALLSGHKSSQVGFWWTSIFLPLGGMFNMIIYTRPKVQAVKKAIPPMPRIVCFIRVLLSGGETPNLMDLMASPEERLSSRPPTNLNSRLARALFGFPAECKRDPTSQTEESNTNEGKEDTIVYQLERLQARSVHELIGPITGDDYQSLSKLLYLTNNQALEISVNKENNDSIKRMMESFYAENKPSLIINLAHSWGFYESTTLVEKENLKKPWAAGIGDVKYEEFDDDDDHGSKTKARLELFIRNVIIPLAEKTNAIIICNAVAKDCILTETLNNVIHSMASRWISTRRLPFTIIKFINQTEVLYMKRKEELEECKWMKIMKQNKQWRGRHKTLLNHYSDQIKKKEKDGVKWWRGHDLDFSLGHLVVVEGLDRAQNPFVKDHRPSSLLMSAILNQFSENLPVIVIKTGATVRAREVFNANAVDLMSLQYLVERANAGNHIVCLDMRRRLNVDSYETSYCQHAKKIHGEATEDETKEQTSSERQYGSSIVSGDNTNGVTLDPKGLLNFLSQSVEPSNGRLEEWIAEYALLGSRRKEVFDCCAVSFLNSEIKNVALKIFTNSPEVQSMLKKTSDLGNDLVEEGSLQRAIALKEQEIDEEIKFSIEKLDLNVIDVAYEFAKEFLRQFEDDLNEEQMIQAVNGMRQHVQDLIISNNVHSINIWTWDYVDKTKQDADRYRTISMTFFRVELLLGFLVTFFSIWGANWAQDALRQVVLGISLALSATVSIESLLSPRTMWRQLRVAEIKLESMIWRYRMCVCNFKTDLIHSQEPEEQFFRELEAWKFNLHNTLQNISGTTIPQSIDFLKKKKFDLRSEMKCSDAENTDNHFSYLTSDQYIEFRVEKLIEVFQYRVPKSVWLQNKYEIAIVVIGVIIAFIAQQNYKKNETRLEDIEITETDTVLSGLNNDVVIILMAIIAILRTWSEFNDIDTSNDLLPSAIAACRTKKIEFKKTTKFRQTAEKKIELVEGIEGISSKVVESWSSYIESSKPYEVPEEVQARNTQTTSRLRSVYGSENVV